VAVVKFEDLTAKYPLLPNLLLSGPFACKTMAIIFDIDRQEAQAIIGVLVMLEIVEPTHQSKYKLKETMKDELKANHQGTI